VFIAYFNGGVRALDIRNPYAPREAAFYIPATTEKTAERCVEANGARRCKVAIQTDNVEADERGFVYLADRANTGLHIVKLTGAASRIIGGNRRPARGCGLRIADTRMGVALYRQDGAVRAVFVDEPRDFDKVVW
jgi:hypothetical protein